MRPKKNKKSKKEEEESSHLSLTRERGRTWYRMIRLKGTHMSSSSSSSPSAHVAAAVCTQERRYTSCRWLSHTAWRLMTRPSKRPGVEIGNKKSFTRRQQGKMPHRRTSTLNSRRLLCSSSARRRGADEENESHFQNLSLLHDEMSPGRSAVLHFIGKAMSFFFCFFLRQYFFRRDVLVLSRLYTQRHQPFEHGFVHSVTGFFFEICCL